MVQSSSGKKKGLRSFTLVHASQVDGCPTKFNKDSRYVKRRPDGAARVAFNQLYCIDNMIMKLFMYCKCS